MRIASLIPSVTETLVALGAEAEIVATTHLCAGSQNRSSSIVTLDPFGDSTYTPKEIAVFLRMLGHASQEGMFAVDQEALAATEPDVVFMQGTCEMCAPGEDPDEQGGVLTGLPSETRVVTLQPHSLGEALANIRQIGQAVGRAPEAEKLLGDLRKRMMAIMRTASQASRGNKRKVALLEWVDPPIAGGMWLPELIEAAGGIPVVGTRHAPAVQTPWSDIVGAQPDVLIFAVTGFDIPSARDELPLLRKRDEWATVPAVQTGEVYLVDGEKYMHSPTPGIIDGLELLATILHSEEFDRGKYGDAIEQVNADQLTHLEPV